MANENYIKSTIVIDEKLNILSNDLVETRGYKNGSIHTVARIVHPSDVIRLEGVLHQVGLEGKTLITLRILDGENVYSWVLGKITCLPMNEDRVKRIRLEIYNLDSLIGDRVQLLNDDELATEYYRLADYLTATYDRESDKLKIFAMDGMNQVNYYSGTMTDWIDTMVANNNVDDISKNSFDTLINDIKNSSESFEREIKARMFNDGIGKIWCVIKGKIISDKNGKTHVIATISRLKSKEDEVDMYNVPGALDVGTDILNKKAITEYTQKLIASTPDYPITIAILDIDNFKEVNDRYGHMFGDEVIRDVANIIKAAVNGKGFAGRIGGDEMFLVANGLVTNDDIRNVLRDIRNNVALLYADEEDKPHVTCSIGSASYPTDGATYEDVFKVADKMLYLAKEKGKNRYVIYREDLHGEYLNGTGKAKAHSDYAFYKYRKIAMVNEIVNDYIQHGETCFTRIVKKVESAFQVDSIYVYTLCDNGMWDRKVLLGEETQDDGNYLNDPAYLMDFREDGVEVIDNINFFNNKVRSVIDAFNNMGHNQAVQFIVNSKDNTPPKVNTRIVSYNRNKQISKWSETDISLLTIIGNILGKGDIDD